MLAEWLLNNKELTKLNKTIKPKNEEERKEKAKIIEYFIAENYNGPDKYMLVQDYYRLPFERSDYYSSKIDLAFGDLICINGQHVDLKVSEASDHVGCISKASLENYKTDKDYWYICCNKDFTKIAVLNKEELVKVIQSKKIKYNPYISGKDLERIANNMILGSLLI